jgi:pilus assembly protein TadC
MPEFMKLKRHDKQSPKEPKKLLSHHNPVERQPDKKPKFSLFKIFKRKGDRQLESPAKPAKPRFRLSLFKRKIGNEKKSELPLNNQEEENKKPKFLLRIFKRKKVEGRIEHFKKKAKKREKILAEAHERRHKLKFYLERAGLGFNPESLPRKFFNVCVFVNLGISAFLIYHFSVTFGITWATILMSIVTLWILIFVVMLFLMWVLFYIAVDLKIFKRKVDIEDVLPDFLQLTASNIKAGMTIDRALWYAVRPRFGVLAREIETVAKETMKGDDLRDALQKFADKYDSVLLKRSISLLIEGIDAGGEIGELLNKIAINIQENKIMRREMAANVTTYVIFISFATVAAAPVLSALAGLLIRVISNLGTSLGGVSSAAASTGFGISFSGSGIEYSDFRIFVIISLMITSFFSSIIIATIQKGSAKYGFKYIPIFMITTISLFLIADRLLGGLLGVFF